MDPARDLTRRRCRHHPSRVAAALCPGCGRFYCRECISEHRERVLCAECLRDEGTPQSVRHKPFATARTALRVASGVLCAWLFFYLLGQVLLRLPDAVHPARTPESAAGDVP